MLVFAWLDRPTMNDWIDKANTACDHAFGDIQFELHAIVLQLKQIDISSLTTSVQDPALTGVIQSIDQLATRFRLMNGDSREIPVPDLRDRTTINALLATTRKFAGQFSGASQALVEFQLDHTKVAKLQEAVSTLQTLADSTLLSWVQSTKKLRLVQCTGLMEAVLAPMPTPTAPTRVPEPTTPVNLGASEQALATQLDTHRLIDCTLATQAENAQIIAAINCTPAQTGPVKRPLVMQFASPDGMASYLNPEAVGRTGRCADGDCSTHWTHNGIRVGRLVCRQDPNGSYRATWTFDDRNIVITTQGADPGTIYEWWKHNAQVLK